MQVIDQVNTAFQNRDTKAYEALTTPEFIRVASNGRVSSRSEWLKNVAASGPQRAPSKYDQVSVRLYGDAAVATYRNLPEDAAVNYLTRVMAKQGTQWLMVLAQSTYVKPPAAPTGPEPPPLPAWSASTAAAREALAAFQAIQKANAANDVVAWERLSAPDHTIVNADGTRTTRAQRVAALKAPPAAAAPAAAPDQNVRVVVKGDLAAVTWTGGNGRSLKIL